MPVRVRPVVFASVLLLVLGLGAIAVGHLLAGETGALLADGVVSPARVVDRRQSVSGKSRSHVLFLEPSPATFARLRLSTSQERYDALALGSQVTVTYLPGTQTAVLGDKAEVRAIQSRSTWAQGLGFAAAASGALLGAVAIVRPRATP